jgi:hypothetical protein
METEIKEIINATSMGKLERQAVINAVLDCIKTNRPT